MNFFNIYLLNSYVMGCCQSTTTALQSACLRCLRPFSIQTLKKYNGLCGRCARAEGRISIRGTIPLRMRQLVWEKYIGANKTVGACYACEQPIKQDAFDCGHVQSTYDEGEISVDNLRPTCRTCNRSSGTMNLDEFKRRLNITTRQQ